jgi:hypothetical protein
MVLTHKRLLIYVGCWVVSVLEPILRVCQHGRLRALPRTAAAATPAIASAAIASKTISPYQSHTYIRPVVRLLALWIVWASSSRNFCAPRSKAGTTTTFCDYRTCVARVVL